MLFYGCFISKISIAEIYARYHNNLSGFEEQVDCNITKSKNDIGMLHHAVFLMLLELNGFRRYYCFDKFDNDVDLSFSEDNSKYTVLSILCALNKYKYQYSCDIHLKFILHYGLKSFFRFGTKLPIHISYWILLFTATKKYPIIQALLYPFLFCKILKKTDVIEDILNLTIVHSFSNSRQFRILRNLFIKKLTRKYGKNFIEILMNSYYTDANHPNRQYAVGVTLKEL